MKEAHAGDVVIEVRCKCAGAVLVAQHAVADWTCGKCGRHATPGKRFRLDDVGHSEIVELEEAGAA